MNNIERIRKNGDCEKMRKIFYNHRHECEILCIASLEGYDDFCEIFKKELEQFDSLEDFFCSISDYVKPSDPKNSFLEDERTIILDLAVGEYVFHPINLIEKYEPEAYRNAVNYYWDKHIKNKNIVKCGDTYFYTDELLQALEKVKGE